MKINVHRKMVRLKIPSYAKSKAREGLNFNKKFPSRAVGLTREESRVLGINSGIIRAKQLLKNQTISLKDARSIRNFYNRFKNVRTKRGEMALNLWGGRKFGKFLVEELKNFK